MTMHASKRRYLPLLIAGIVVVSFSTAGIARIMGLLSASTGDSSELQAFDKLPAASANAIAGTAQTVPQPPRGAQSAKGEGRSKGRCAECGLIVSMVEKGKNDEDSGLIDAGRVTTDNRIKNSLKLTKSYKITIRMADGSIRAITHASPASWRPGERVILIAGATSSSR